MTTVKLQMERETASGGIEYENVVIKKMKTRQLNKTMKAVTAIMDIVADSPELQDLLLLFLQGAPKFNRKGFEGLTDQEVLEEQEKFKTQQDELFYRNVMGSFRILCTRLPDETVDLLAAISKVDVELLLDQDPIMLFDVAEAIMKVNNLGELVERGKQFFSHAKHPLMELMGTKKETEKETEIKSIPQA